MITIATLKNLGQSLQKLGKILSSDCFEDNGAFVSLLEQAVCVFYIVVFPEVLPGFPVW